MLLSFPSVYLWVAVLIIAIIIEAASPSLTTIWFGVGALVALISAEIGVNIIMQMVVFIIASSLLIIFIRPLTKNVLKVKDVKTNADRIIGQNALVTTDIDNVLSQGEIIILGQHWSARNSTDFIIPKGSMVKILSISGVKAIVEPIPVSSTHTN